MEAKRSNRKNVPTTAICLQCGIKFQKATALNDLCSAKCKRAHANQLRDVKPKIGRPVKIKTEKPVKEKPIVQSLNKHQKKNEKDAALNMLELNRNAPAHDREVLKKKKIVSPDLKDMKFHHHDKRMKITYYFITEEKYNNYLINNPQ